MGADLMSNIIDFMAAKERKEIAGEERKETEDILSNPMGRIIRDMCKQAAKESCDNLLNMYPTESDDGTRVIQGRLGLSMFKDLKHELEDVVMAMDYVIETIDGEEDE